MKKVLDNNREPQLPSDVGHAYIDKFSLASFITNTALAAQLNCLYSLGLAPELLKQVKDWSKCRSVTLAFAATETCEFSKKANRDIHPDVTHQTETSSRFGKATFSAKTITTVTEYFWQHKTKWELYVYQGNNPADRVVLKVHTADHLMTTGSNTQPLPEAHVTNPVEVHITWLMQTIDDQGLLCFKIDRLVPTCKTPRRNSDVSKALSFTADLHNWTEQVGRWFESFFSRQNKTDLDLSAIDTVDLFVPIIPLFEERSKREAIIEVKEQKEEQTEEKKEEGDATVETESLSNMSSLVEIGPNDDGTTGPLLPLRDVHLFLSEQQRTLTEKFTSLSKVFPASEKPLSPMSVTLVVTLKHLRQVRVIS